METIISLICLCTASLAAVGATVSGFKSSDQTILFLLWAIFLMLLAIYGKIKR